MLWTPESLLVWLEDWGIFVLGGMVRSWLFLFLLQESIGGLLKKNLFAQYRWAVTLSFECEGILETLFGLVRTFLCAFCALVDCKCRGWSSVSLTVERMMRLPHR